MGTQKDFKNLSDITKIILNSLATDLNMQVKDMIELSNFAVFNDSPLSFRPINPYTPKRLAEGAIGKRAVTKAKTSPTQAGEFLAGLVPLHPSFGRYGFQSDINPKFLQLHEDNTTKQIEADDKKIIEIEKFCNLIDKNSKISQRTYDNGEEEFVLNKQGIILELTIPPAVKSAPDSPDPLGQELDLQRFANNLQNLVVNRFHKSRPVIDAKDRQIFAFIDKNQRPILQDNMMITCYQKNGKFYDTNNSNLYQIKSGQNPIALEVICYKQFEVKIDEERQKIQFITKEESLDITSDYDQLTICKRGKVSDHGNMTPISPDKKGSFGHGKSTWNTTITEGLSQIYELDNVICHNQESSNIYFNPFENEIYPIFLPGSTNLINETEDNFETRLLRISQDQGLIAKIENLAKNNEINLENYKEKLKDWIAMPKGQEELIKVFDNMVNLGYFVQIKEQWKQDYAAWKDLDVKQKANTDTPSSSPTPQLILSPLSPKRKSIFVDQGEFELTDIENNRRTSKILERRISRKSVTYNNLDERKASITSLNASESLSQAGELDSYSGNFSRKNTINSDSSLLTTSSSYTGSRKSSSKSNIVTNSNDNSLGNFVNWESDSFLKPIHKRKNRSTLSIQTSRASTSSISDEYFPSSPSHSSNISDHDHHKNVMDDLASQIEKEQHHFRNLYKNKSGKSHRHKVEEKRKNDDPNSQSR